MANSLFTDGAGLGKTKPPFLPLDKNEQSRSILRGQQLFSCKSVSTLMNDFVKRLIAVKKRMLLKGAHAVCYCISLKTNVTDRKQLMTSYSESLNWLLILSPSLSLSLQCQVIFNCGCSKFRNLVTREKKHCRRY